MLRASGHPPDVRAGDDLWNDQVVVFARILYTMSIDRQRRVFVQRPQGQVERRRAEDI